MKIAVRYFSRSGNTKKLGNAIANALGTQAESCNSPLDGKVDLLFLGGSVYGGDLDKNLQKFIENLEPENVKSVVLFGTSAIALKPYKKMEKELMKKNIPVSPERFFCRGSFAILHRGRPNAEDLALASKFAGNMVNN
ncbi:MAG: flavodoxin [Treponema sp.]|nr:flavodoxin [Treponema sp.]